MWHLGFQCEHSSLSRRNRVKEWTLTIPAFQLREGIFNSSIAAEFPNVDVRVSSSRGKFRRTLRTLRKANAQHREISRFRPVPAD